MGIGLKDIGGAISNFFKKGGAHQIISGIKTGANILSDPLVGAGITAVAGPEVGLPVLAGANLVKNSPLLNSIH